MKLEFARQGRAGMMQLLDVLIYSARRARPVACGGGRTCRPKMCDKSAVVCGAIAKYSRCWPFGLANVRAMAKLSPGRNAGAISQCFSRRRRLYAVYRPYAVYMSRTLTEGHMLQRVCLALSVCALAFFFVGGLSQAGWSGLGLTSAHDASSLVISVKKHKHQDDDADDDDNGLEQCTIQKPKSGMGCVAPAKLVCQKMKNGKKCCGCVGGPSKATTTPPPAATTQTYKCLSSFIPGLGTIDCTVVKGSEDEAYGYCLQSAQASFPNAQVPAGALKCSLIK